MLKQGHIVESGSFDELVAADGYFSELVKAGVGGTADVTSDGVSYNGTAETALAGATETAIGTADAIGNSHTKPYVDIEKAVHPVIAAHAAPGATHIEVSEPTQNISTWNSLSRLFAVLGPARNSLWLSLLFSFLTVFMNVGLLTTSAWLITSAALRLNWRL